MSGFSVGRNIIHASWTAQLRIHRFSEAVKKSSMQEISIRFEPEIQIHRRFSLKTTQLLIIQLFLPEYRHMNQIGNWEILIPTNFFATKSWKLFTLY